MSKVPRQHRKYQKEVQRKSSKYKSVWFGKEKG